LKKRNIIIIFCLIVVTTQLKAQKVQFSQFYAAPLVLSPSYTGLIDGSRVVFNYRDQWPNIPGTFTTYAFSYDQFFYRMKSGVGLSVVRDVAGSGNLSLTDIGLLYSYDLQINRKWHVRPGIKFKYGQRGIDIAELIFGDQLDDEGNVSPSSIDHSSTLNKTGYIDVDASALAYHNRYWAGLTVSNLLRPNQSLTGNESRVPIKLTVFGGTRLPIKGNRRRSHEVTESVTFSMLYQFQDKSDQLDLGAYWYKAPFTLGLWFRGIPGFTAQTGYQALDAVIVLVGFQVYDLKFGYSYDYTLSKLNQSATGGAHEVSIIYEFNKNIKWKRNQRKVTIPCPDF
jgi:type IX secretion system PorP/SprF family membrane protein